MGSSSAGLTPQFPVLLRRERKAAPHSQTPLTEGEGSGEYIYIPEGGGAALPQEPGRTHRAHRTRPLWRLPVSPQALRRRPVLSAIGPGGIGAAHRVLPGRGRAHRHDTGVSSIGHSLPEGRGCSGRGATRSSPARGTAPLLRSGVAGPAFCLPASPHQASLSQTDYKSQHALGRAARCSARRTWGVVFWDA